MVPKEELHQLQSLARFPDGLPTELAVQERHLYGTELGYLNDSSSKRLNYP
jgi:hypothetical protein